MKKVFYTAIFGILFAVADAQVATLKPTETPDIFVEKIQKAHRFDNFHQQQAIAFDIDVSSGGKPVLFATITTLTSSGKIRLQQGNGKTVIFDGKKTWLYPAETDYPRARFDIFTYHYFFMAPFKVRDKGTLWQLMPDQTLQFNDYARARLSFQNGIGDSPDDWYIVYRNKATNYLEAMAYIVTYGGKSQTEAAKKPSSIVFSDWQAVGGVIFPTTWQFRSWSEDKGFSGLKAEAKITNIRFITPTAATFAVPKGSREIDR